MSPSTAAATRATAGAVGLSAAVAAVFYAGAALSGVDGFLGVGEYGMGSAAQVGYNPAAPDRSPSTSANESRYVTYDRYLRSDPSFYYGLFQARPGLDGTFAGTFSNIYVDLDPANNNGADLGLEIGNAANAFIPGVPGGVILPEVAIARSGDGLTFEFAIPTSRLTGPITGLTYLPDQEFPTASNPNVVFSPSQSFGNPVAVGGPYGNGQPGRVAMAATDVPEPATAALFLVGLAGAGVLRPRRGAS